MMESATGMKRLLSVVALTACVVVLVACGSAPSPELAGTPSPASLHPLGTPVSTGAIVVTVNGVSQPTGGTRPKPGDRYLAVDLTLENDSNQVTDISTLVMMWLRDSAGHIYRPNVTATNVATQSQETMDGPLVPTEPDRGKVGFQVPNGAHGFIFQFQPRLNGPITSFDLKQ